MKIQAFNTLTKEDLHEGLLLCFKNAEKHFFAAKLLVEKKLYGFANSHLILAGEESIKAIILSIKFIIPEEMGSGMKDEYKIFSDHRVKHLIAKANYDTFKKMLDLYLEKLCVAANIKKELCRFKIPTAELWDNANNKKNVGFYVDINNCKWRTPEVITKEGYEETYSMVRSLLALKYVFLAMIKSRKE